MVTGVLLDRFRGNLVGGITLGAAAIAFAGLAEGTSNPALILVAMLVNGYTAGAKLQIASYLTVQHAGMRNFGKIYGVMTSVVAVGSGAGPVVAGAIYDATGGYGPFLMLGAVASLLAGLLVVSLPAYPGWEERLDGEELSR
jgi:MFS family permease